MLYVVHKKTKEFQLLLKPSYLAKQKDFDIESAILQALVGYTKYPYKVLSKQESIGKVDEETPAKDEETLKQFKRKAITTRGSSTGRQGAF